MIVASGLGKMAARILIVEDDALLALDVVRVLESAGFAVVGPAGSSAKALDLIAKVRRCCCARYQSGRNVTSEPVAKELIAQGKRFVTVTGYSHDQRPSIYDGHPILTKPLRRGALVAELNRLLRLDGQGRRRQISNCVPRSTTRSVGILKKLAAVAALRASARKALTPQRHARMQLRHDDLAAQEERSRHHVEHQPCCLHAASASGRSASA